MQSSTFIITCGVAGSGKTFVRGCRFVIDRFLLDNQTGRHISNLPLNIDAIAEHVSERDSRIYEDVVDQLEIIPAVEMKKWENEESGPWEYFANVDLTDCHIAIDEAHRVCGSKHSKEHVKQWQIWIGELRHQGAACEFITQAESKLPREIRDEAGLMYFLEDRAYRRDGIFSIPFSDWSELSACFTRRYSSAFCVHEVRDIGGRKQKFDGAPAIVERDPFYFKFYDSYSAPNENAKAAREKKYEFEKRSRVGLVLWFLRRNVINFMFSKPTAILLILFLFVSGTATTVFNSVLTSFVGVSTLSPEEKKIEELEGIVERLQTSINNERRKSVTLSNKVQSTKVALVKSQFQLRRNEVLGVFGNIVHLKEGGRVQLDEIIQAGPLKGRSVSGVDPDKFLIRLSDGTTISYFERTEFSRSLQANSAGQRVDQYSANSRSKGNIFPSSGTSVAPGTTGTEFYNGQNYSGRTGPGNNNYFSRSAPSNLRGNSGSNQQSSRPASNQAGQRLYNR